MNSVELTYSTDPLLTIAPNREKVGTDGSWNPGSQTKELQRSAQKPRGKQIKPLRPPHRLCELEDKTADHVDVGLTLPKLHLFTCKLPFH